MPIGVGVTEPGGQAPGRVARTSLDQVREQPRGHIEEAPPEKLLLARRPLFESKGAAQAQRRRPERARVGRGRGSPGAGARRLQKSIAVGLDSVAQRHVAAGGDQDVVAKFLADQPQRLPEGLPGLTFGDVRPKQFAQGPSGDGPGRRRRQIDEHGERLARTERRPGFRGRRLCGGTKAPEGSKYNCANGPVYRSSGRGDLPGRSGLVAFPKLRRFTGSGKRM